LFGFIAHPRIRTKIAATQCVALIWLSTGYYHSLFGTSAITDWIYRWAGQLSCILTVLHHLELLKYFLEIGSYVTVQNINSLMVFVLGIYLSTSTSIYLFLPTLNQVPSQFIVTFYSVCEIVLILTTIVTDTWYYIHLVQLLLKFIKTKRIRTNYTPIQARNIIWITTLGTIMPWTAFAIYLFNNQKNYSDHCWGNISSSFGVYQMIALPFIFKMISRMNPVPLTDFHKEKTIESPENECQVDCHVESRKSSRLSQTDLQFDRYENMDSIGISNPFSSLKSAPFHTTRHVHMPCISASPMISVDDNISL
jgi:hypothetical protein